MSSELSDQSRPKGAEPDGEKVLYGEVPSSPRESLPAVREDFEEQPDQLPKQNILIQDGPATVRSAENSKEIPPWARWTKIDRQVVNPEALEEAGERFEERLGFVIVFRILTKNDVQRLADRTAEIREERDEMYEEEQRKKERAWLLVVEGKSLNTDPSESFWLRDEKLRPVFESGRLDEIPKIYSKEWFNESVSEGERGRHGHKE